MQHVVKDGLALQKQAPPQSKPAQPTVLFTRAQVKTRTTVGRPKPNSEHAVNVLHKPNLHNAVFEPRACCTPCSQAGTNQSAAAHEHATTPIQLQNPLAPNTSNAHSVLVLLC